MSSRGGFETGQGLTIRVYEVLADGTRRDIQHVVHTYGSRPIPAPPRPRRYGEPDPDAKGVGQSAGGASPSRGRIVSGS